jgi:F-box/TPR repeat protein Pof3
MRDRLERQLAPPKSLDPLTVFPVEVAEMVLNYLNFKNRVYGLGVHTSVAGFTN